MIRKNAMYIVVVSSLMILFCLVYQGTYSYFSRGFQDNRVENKANLTTADLQDLTLVEGNNNSSNLLIPGESVDATFTVTNPSTMKVCFQLNWTQVTNTFENKSDLIVTLENSKGELLATTTFPSTDSVFTTTSIAANTTETYKVTVTYRNTEENQFGDMGKSFNAKINGELTVCPTP